MLKCETGAFQRRKQTCRVGVAEIFTKKLSVTELGKFLETSDSGLFHHLGKVASRKASRVQIPPFPPVMQNKYFEKVTKLLEKSGPKLATTYRLEFKNVFGAVGGFVNGRIFISCGKFGLALKLPAKALEKLFNKKVAKHLKYFPNGHIKKEYAVLPKRITEDTRHFRKLVDESIEYVLKINT